MKKILVALVVVMFSFNTCFALDPTSFLNSLIPIDNKMYVVIDSLTNTKYDKDYMRKYITTTESNIASLRKDVDFYDNKELKLMASLILDNYNLSLMYAKKYIESKSTDDLISMIHFYTEGINTGLLRSNISNIKDSEIKNNDIPYFHCPQKYNLH